jgi:hypothetical protein
LREVLVNISLIAFANEGSDLLGKDRPSTTATLIDYAVKKNL